MNEEEKGQKICIEMNDNREWLVTSVDGDPGAFHKIKGHMVVKDKESGSFEIMWT